MNKFAKVASHIKTAAMEDFIAGNGTTREIGQRYGFCHRRLKAWFDEAGRSAEFVTAAQRNIIGSQRQPMPITAKVQITGFRCLNWKDGQHVESRRGLIEAIQVAKPDHPHARKNKYVAQHRLVMESVLGRTLAAGEIVHHIDLNPTNNHPDNLLVMSSTEHGVLHSYLQVALVHLMPVNELRALTRYLLNLARELGPKRDNTRANVSRARRNKANLVKDYDRLSSPL